MIAGQLVLVGEARNSSDIPQAVREDAEKLARDLVESDSEQGRLLEELLAAYSVARQRDFLTIGNPGGFGRKGSESDPEWGSVIDGIESTLKEMGYAVVRAQYVRTPEGLGQFLREFGETLRGYPEKAKALKAEVAFLTQHIADLKVILTGNSDGGVYTNAVLRLLAGNPRVYGIMCGVPFYCRAAVPERTLVINDNGVIPDVLSRGNIASIVWANVTHLPRYRSPEGHIMLYLRAPGHIYTWDHIRVREKIVSFLKANFGRS